MKRTAALLILAVALLPGMAQASEFWVDPVHGKPGNDGSSSAPWRSLQEIVDRGFIESQQWESLPYKEGARLVPRNTRAPVKGGDTIYLRSGYHGDLRISGFYNTREITVVAQDGHAPRFRSVRVVASSHWVFRGLHVSAEYASSYEKTVLFNLDTHAWHGPVHDVVVEDCRLQSVEDSSGWSAGDWNTLSCNGLQVDGVRMTIRRNALKNVNFGIVAAAERSLIERNVVENFAADGVQGNGNHSTYQYNTIKNSYKVNGNHDDGFQSWAPMEGGVRTSDRVGIVVRGNTIINYEDANQPHRGALQGIGCFGGGFVDFVIENNVVITDHGHGITLQGARNSRIVNNSVLHPHDARHGPARIMIMAPEGRARCEGCLVRNNLATAIGIPRTQGVVADHNLIIKNRSRLFVDAAGHNLRLKKGSRAVDAGSAKMAPGVDIEGVARPWGDGYDIGAYEYHEGESDPEPTKMTDQRADEAPPEAQAPRVQSVMDGDAQIPNEVKVDRGNSASLERGVSYWLGSVQGWGVVPLALLLLLIAWRVGP